MKDWTLWNDGSVLWRLDKGRPATEAAGTFCFVGANEDERTQPALLASSLRLWLHSDKRWRTFSRILKLIWNNLSSFFSFFFRSRLSRKGVVTAAPQRLALSFCCSENASLWWNVWGRPLSLRPDLNYPLRRILPTANERGSHLPPVWRWRRQSRSWLAPSQQISKSVWVFRKKREIDKRKKTSFGKIAETKQPAVRNQAVDCRVQVQIRRFSR